MRRDGIIKTGFLFAAITLLNACATQTLVNYEEGDIIKEHQNPKQTPQPTRYDVSLERVGEGAQAGLKVSIVKNNPIKEEWEDVYSKVGVYEMRCKVYKNREDDHHRYCEFNSEWFWKIHAELLGLPFLYDIFVLPFWPYDDRTVESKEPVDGTMLKTESSVTNVESPIDARSIKVTIGRATATSAFSNGSAQFDFSALRLNPAKWPDDVKASVAFGDQHLDISTEFATFVEKERQDRIAAQEAAEAEQRKPQNKYKMAFCHNPDLFAVVFASRASIEPNCIYGIGVAPLKVLQVVAGGILVRPTDLNPYILDKVIFIKTDKQYVDGDFVQKIYVKSVGPLSYESVMGAGKTVNAFQYLGDIN